MMPYLTLVAFMLFWWPEALSRDEHHHLHDICKSELRILWLQSGDTGSIFLHANDSAAILSHPGFSQSCHVQLLACDTCKLRVTIRDLQFPACEEMEAPQFPVCMASCSHLLFYESSYSDITSQFYYVKNTTESFNQTYTTISSSLYIKMCLSNRLVQNATISIEITYQVLDKVEVFTGSPSGLHHQGLLLSPAFPHGYALMGEKYAYTLTNTEPTGRVHLLMTDWDLTPNSRVLIYDCLNRSDCEPSVHYGYYFRPVETSVGPTLHLVFEPEYGTVETRSSTLGFRATYSYLVENTSVVNPITACGKYFGYRPGGGGHMTFSMSQRLYEGRLHDCVWVVRKHSAFDYVLLRLEKASFVNNNWKLEVRSSVTSQSTTLDILQPAHQVRGNQSATNVSLPKLPWERRSYTSFRGFYIRLTGLLSSRDDFAFTFVSFNKPTQGNCGHTSDHYCADNSVPRGGICIDRHLVCDGHAHCANGRDEGPLCTYQQATPRTVVPVSLPSCGPREFRCSGPGPRLGKCIPSHMACDGWMDCHDGSDEYYCGTTASMLSAQEGGCLPGAVLCGGDCVPVDQICALASCQDRWSRWKCPSNLPKTREVDLGLVFPLCFVAFVVIIAIFAIAIRVRKRLKPIRHQVLSPPLRPSRLPSRSRRPRSGVYCGNPGTCLHLSRSTSAASSEPFLTNPPSYEDSLIGSPAGEAVAESCIGLHTTSQNTSPLLEPPPPYTNTRPLLHNVDEMDTMIS